MFVAATFQESEKSFDVLHVCGVSSVYVAFVSSLGFVALNMTSQLFRATVEVHFQWKCSAKTVLTPKGKESRDHHW